MAGIVIVVLAAVVALVAFARWRKARKDQQVALMKSGAGAPAAMQIQMNPVQPYGGAPPTVPYGGAPPIAPYGGAPPQGQPMPPGPPTQYVWH